jgi:WD40 repeat protein
VLYLRGHETRLFSLSAPAEDGNREDTGAARRSSTLSPSAPHDGRREDSPVAHAGPRARQPLAARADPGYLAAAREPSRICRILTGHSGQVIGVAFSPDGTLLATGSPDKTARLWDVATGASVRTLTGHSAEVAGVAFSPDGTLLATGSHDNTARLWA